MVGGEPLKGTEAHQNGRASWAWMQYHGSSPLMSRLIAEQVDECADVQLSHDMVTCQSVTKHRRCRCSSNRLDQIRQLLLVGRDDMRFKHPNNMEPIIKIYGQRDQFAVSGALRDGQEESGGSVRMIEAIKAVLILW